MPSRHSTGTQSSASPRVPQAPSGVSPESIIRSNSNTAGCGPNKTQILLLTPYLSELMLQRATDPNKAGVTLAPQVGLWGFKAHVVQNQHLGLEQYGGQMLALHAADLGLIPGTTI